MRVGECTIYFLLYKCTLIGMLVSISITANLGSDGTPFPIFMQDTPIEIKVGDAVLYKGCEIPHGRKGFQGDWHSQVFYSM